MPRQRTRPNSPFVSSLMAKYECKDVKELSDKTGIPYSTLINYAEMHGSHKVLEAAMRDARLLGLSLEEFVKQLLGLQQAS